MSQWTWLRKLMTKSSTRHLTNTSRAPKHERNLEAPAPLESRQCLEPTPSGEVPERCTYGDEGPQTVTRGGMNRSFKFLSKYLATILKANLKSKRMLERRTHAPSGLVPLVMTKRHKRTIKNQPNRALDETPKNQWKLWFAGLSIINCRTTRLNLPHCPY